MKVILRTLVIGLVVFCTTCLPPGQSGQAGDQNGLRIVSLAPNLTEILFELGVGEQVIGVTTHCNYPPEAQSREKVGDFIYPNLEKIVSLKPDLVLAEHWPSSKTVPRLREFQVDVFETTSSKSLSEIYDTVRQVGQAVGKVEVAERLVEDMKHRIEVIKERAPILEPRPTVYTEIDLPTWTIGRRSFITESLRLCGLRNLFEDIDRPAMLVSREEIIARNPDIILSFTLSAGDLRQRPGWDQILAVQTGRIIDDVNPDLLVRGNHRLVIGLEQLQTRVLEMLDER